MSHVNFLSLNCCGLVRRSQYPEFVDLINEYDFICLNETKTSDFDNIFIPGYTFKFKHRKTNTKVKSGGIAFGYKNELDKFVSHIDTNSKHILWFKISEEYLNLDSDLLVGNVYIPPENSVYKVEDVFNEIEQEYLQFCSRFKYVLLNGDFNARIGVDLDFYDFSCNLHEESNNIPENIANTLHLYGMKKYRSSKDLSKNAYGNYLRELCRNNNMFILNGRVNGDMEGMFTCRQSSVIDYFICTYDLLPNVDSLYVHDFSSLFSDVHSPVSMTLNVYNFEKTDILADSDNLLINDVDTEKIKKMGM